MSGPGSDGNKGVLCILQSSSGLGVRVFANGPGDLGSIPGRVIPKTQKMVLDASLLNTQHYKVRIKGKVEQSREGVAPSPTHWCSSYRKESLRVTLDYGRQLYLLTIRLFSVISRTLVWRGVLPLYRETAGVFHSPSRLGKKVILNFFVKIHYSYKIQLSDLPNSKLPSRRR